MKRIAFYTLGCKVNQADTASMEAIFRSHGYTVVGFTFPKQASPKNIVKKSSAPFQERYVPSVPSNEMQ